MTNRPAFLWYVKGGLLTRRGYGPISAGTAPYDPLTYGFGPYGTYEPDHALGLSGIPAGTPALAPQFGTNGVYVINTPGWYDRIDFFCEVSIRVRGVKFSRCNFRGNPARSTNGALANVGAAAPYGQGTVAQFYHCEFNPDSPSIWLTAVTNHDFELYGCYIRGTVDGIGAFGTGSSSVCNVKLFGTHIEKLAYFSPDPNHPNDKSGGLPTHPYSKTHNDVIQWQGGRGLTVVGNKLVGYLDPTIGAASFASTPTTTADKVKAAGPNNTTFTQTDSYYNGNHPSMNIPGAILQVSGLNGGECSGLDWHHNWVYGAERPLTVSQVYADLGTMHDDIVAHDHLASVWGNIPDSLPAGSFVVSNMKYQDGSHVPAYMYHRNADGSISGRTVVTT